MITATLHPPRHTPETTLETYRYVLKLARREQAELLNRARKRSKTYSRKARESAYKAGFAEGLQEGKEQFSGALRAIVTHYEAAVDRATEDVMTVAHQIVEHVIASYLQEHPEQLRQWILQSLESLKHSRCLTLKYHPRYHHLLTPFTQELEGILKTASEPSLGDADFELETNTGAITFSWREMLRTLSVGVKPGRKR